MLIIFYASYSLNVDANLEVYGVTPCVDCTLFCLKCTNSNVKEAEWNCKA